MKFRRTIETTLKEIIEVLEEVDENNWKLGFVNTLEEYKKTKERDALKRRILRLYGGMGSFNDLVLHKNGEICITENNKLDKLRKRLFDQIMNSY